MFIPSRRSGARQKIYNNPKFWWRSRCKNYMLFLCLSGSCWLTVQWLRSDSLLTKTASNLSLTYCPLLTLSPHTWTNSSVSPRSRGLRASPSSARDATYTLLLPLVRPGTHNLLRRHRHSTTGLDADMCIFLINAMISGVVFLANNVDDDESVLQFSRNILLLFFERKSYHSEQWSYRKEDSLRKTMHIITVVHSLRPIISLPILLSVI